MDFDLYSVHIMVYALGPFEERDRKNVFLKNLLNPWLKIYNKFYRSKVVPDPDGIRVLVNYAIRDISTHNRILIYITKHKVLYQSEMEDFDIKTFKRFIRKSYTIVKEKENKSSKTKEFELVEIDDTNIHETDFMTHFKIELEKNTQ